jgi:gluconokinase
MAVLALMGVSGSGKTTVAALLAGQLGWDLLEGDDLHPPENVAKMASGHALTDEDRWPWLAHIAQWIDEHVETGRPGVVTCSALKRTYRDVLRRDEVTFVLLSGSEELIRNRMVARHGHFMPTGLLDSQFATLEPPGADEQAITVDVSGGPAKIADEITERLHLEPTAAHGEPV